MDTKALRQKIFDLAIRGKLVPQDPNDEPASVLLERIREQKLQMVKEGKLKKKDIKNDSVIFKGEDNLHYEKFQDGTMKCIEDEIPFEVPEGWAWARLGYLAQYKKGPFGSSITKSMFIPDSTNAIKVYEQKNAINKDETLGTYFISVEKYETLKNFEVFPNDIIVSCAGTIGETYVLPLGMRKGIINQALMKISLFDLSLLDFYLMYFDFQLKNIAQEQGHGIALKNIPSLAILKNYLVPIPPIQEQQRIIEKTQLLLTLVDSVDIDSSAVFKLIDKTKFKILDLAIRGKLVPQDPNEEPASALLERIQAEKLDLIKQGKIKRDKKRSIIFKGDDNSYYLRTGKLEESLDDWQFDNLPETWELCCLGEVCNYGDCINVDTTNIADDAWILDLEDIEKDTGKVLKKITKAQRNSVSTKHQFHSGQVLYSKLRPYLNKVVLSDDDGYCTSEILPLEFAKCVLPEYARYYFMSKTFLAYTDRCSYGVKMPRLGTADGKKAIFPLPPLAEQIRIVEHIHIAYKQFDLILNSLL